MGSRRRTLPAVRFLFPFLMAFQLCASLNQEGSALLRIKEVIDADPYSALLDGDEGNVSPCSWFGVKCSDDGRVMALNMRSAATRKLLEGKDKGSQKNKFAPSVSNFEEMAIIFTPTPFPKLPVRPHLHHIFGRRANCRPREQEQQIFNNICTDWSSDFFFVVVALLAAFFFYYCHRNTSTVVPLSAISSIQLQTTAIEGITLFRLSQLEKVSEGFSNIIGTLPGCTLYKGTLPCGAEIAVVSTSVAYAGGWSPTAETHFKNKIEILSMVNHKNLMNLVGYCEDGEPFTLMMVFEYVSNGWLFEHLHVKEAEHLNWQARLRIAMGVIYCLDYLHLQSPPVNLRNLNSSIIYLSEDNAAKVSDIFFFNGKKEGKDEFNASDEYNTVYKFALLLLEIISGRRPYSDNDGLLVLWAHRYLNGVYPVMGMVDPTLNSVPEEQVTALSELIRLCISEDSRLRLTIAEVTKRMQDITGITRDQPIPRNSALWWAELEIITL